MSKHESSLFPTTTSGPKLFAALLATTLLTSGCAPALIGATALTATAAAQEKGLGGAISDTEVQARINHLWFQHSLDMHQRLNMTINQGKVLLTGRARDPDMRLDAVRLAWQAQGVKEVINEIDIDDASTIQDSALDSWISTRLRSRILFEKHIRSINYTVETVNRVVYLMGIAQTQNELDRVVAITRSIPRVARVVSYVEVCCEQTARQIQPAP